MLSTLLMLLATILVVVLCKPLEAELASIQLRNTLELANSANTPTSEGIRWKRQAEAGEECEKLQLCKLHARSRNNFFSAFELYFVNKENARLWDHRLRSIQDCHRRYGYC